MLCSPKKSFPRENDSILVEFVVFLPLTEDRLLQDAGECSICLDDMVTGKCEITNHVNTCSPGIYSYLFIV